MSQSLRKKLNELGTENLIDIIVNMANENSETKKQVLVCLAAHNPKEMYKILNKEITDVKNGKRFISYSEADDFTSKLESISDKISKHLAKQSPDIALKLCMRLIEIDSKIFERVDDSNGCLGFFYNNLFHLLDKVFSYSSEKPEKTAETILSIYFNDQYGNRGYIVDHLKFCLTEPVIKALGKLLPEIKRPDSCPALCRDNPAWDFDLFIKNDQVISIHKKIADARKDVDQYIDLVKLDNVCDKDICEIAKRLNDAFRSEEAIEWLMKIKNRSSYAYERDRLFIEAYKLEGDTTKVKEVLWNRFERDLDVDTYHDYLKVADDKEKTTAAQIALVAASHASHVSIGLKLLHDLGEFDALEELFFAREEEVDGYNYSVYRKMSTSLHKNGKSLVATLLRRKLIDNVLDNARSKSYRYAASDLKMAANFADHVYEWRGHPNHTIYLVLLKNQHPRKRSFWSLLADIDIPDNI